MKASTKISKLTSEQRDELIKAHALGYQAFKDGIKIPMQDKELKSLLEGRDFRTFIGDKLPTEPLLLAWHEGYSTANLYS